MNLLCWGAALLSLAAATDIGTPRTDVIARAAGHELRSVDAALILASNPEIPADPQVIRQLADLWIDYTLLATAAAEDSSLSTLNLDEVVRTEREGLEVTRYLQARATPVPELTDAELDRLWVTEGPGEEVRARHILLKLDETATPEQLRVRAEAIRVRAAAGEDFAALARQLSEDSGSKDSGGDLDWFGRGRMVPAFESAAFKLKPGEVSPVVESPFGYHVIKLDGRRITPIGDRREPFRQMMTQAAQQRAVAAFVASRRTLARLAVRSGAEDEVRRLVGEASPARPPAASGPLVTYAGGEVTAAEIAQALQDVPAEARAQLRSVPAGEITTLLETQATQELLLVEARREGFALTAAESGAMRAQARDLVRELLRSSGLDGLSSTRGEAGRSAIQQAVQSLLTQAVAGQRQLPPLGRLGFALRSTQDAEIYAQAFPDVVARSVSPR